MSEKNKCEDCDLEIDYTEEQNLEESCGCGKDWEWALKQMSNGKRISWLDWKDKHYVKDWDGGENMMVYCNGPVHPFATARPYKLFKRWALYSAVKVSKRQVSETT